MKSTMKAVATRVVGARATAALASVYRWWRASALSRERIGPSQSNEAAIIARLLDGLAAPRSFCEFGFDISQFNCGQLAREGWDGLLIDGDAQRVAIAQRALAREPRARVSALNAFLTLDNVDSVVGARFGDAALGVLSVDVDGNDYWLLEKLLPRRPSLVVVEYNASFGLRSLTVPYDPAFERHTKHPSGWYHGASITALARLCARHGYQLAAVSDAGLNAFFLRTELAGAATPALVPETAYRENSLRNRWSRTDARQQWAAIASQPYVPV
jgi:hypothetical protein